MVKFSIDVRVKRHVVMWC